ncbi:amino acid synthesis family protein [Burkholderia contaminans]|uniref:amino acid synthesis family protein n=1 Tax=Burkholderia cepacia complex TaxID=87882 RepID=UPI000F580B21|nr:MULTISPECIES: amino acid synthesis family protein [Burkholderia cepacia complex]MCA8155595.1 amino acid synthesis family protein [Burkholderia contaminans]RQT01217.1 amino acid synthesis family protein [Burkholderia contaminans]RQT07508.1 amino acid synthesis family protein [Burkholderia contaminans]
MPLVNVRKIKLDVEEVWHEGGERVREPLRVAVATAVVANPYAGRYEPDLLPFMQALRELGHDLSSRLVALLGGAENVQAYGKGAIVGEDGELEHGAVWHEAGGWAMRESLGQPKAMVPSAKTIGGVGTRLMVPLGHIQASYVRSHYGTCEVTVWDGPRRNEIAFALAMATGGRVHARLGGLAASDVKGLDGLR